MESLDRELQPLREWDLRADLESAKMAVCPARYCAPRLRMLV